MMSAVTGGNLTQLFAKQSIFYHSKIHNGQYALKHYSDSPLQQ
jgi:hypothetical protein